MFILNSVDIWKICTHGGVVKKQNSLCEPPSTSFSCQKQIEPHTNLQVNDELLGGGEGGELSSRPHADPRHCSARAPPQSQNAMISVDGNQGVGHPLW